ncbi:MAG: uroporphyrinogen-III synthase [Sphingomonas sp.]|uniref:uroporphyrinogen-III synthase n=1 Tax=Sphingomonas sp. TaxID=28214 RepID=UPI001AFD5421|nr:uroporphyrinogen-III synthase [Sphingomonas sp.]MBO9621891.1 uroporphyrinogen-III synthase [Sphingomonas sp.]
MSRAIAVLRPEPGNRATAAAIEGRGRRAIRLPLFEVRPLPWTAPDPRDFDALLLTSANAVRHAGPALAALAPLPVHAVGRATAEAARRAGLQVVAVGDDGAATLVADAEKAGVRRALHLAGRERTLEAGGIIAAIVTVYASEPLPVPPEAVARLAGSVALLQSTRAAHRLAELVPPPRRSGIALAAVSARAAAAAGPGWQRVEIAADPSAETLIEAAIALAD